MSFLTPTELFLTPIARPADRLTHYFELEGPVHKGRGRLSSSHAHFSAWGNAAPGR